jgi:uncharacterized protein (TIGR02271 family)
MINTGNLQDVIGADVVDAQNEKVGKVGQVYVDSTDNQPAWVSVKTGLFGTSETFVPLDAADWDAQVLHVPYDKAMIKDAPRIESDGEISEAEQDTLYEYYGIGTGAAGSGGFDTTSSTTGYDTVGTGAAGTTGFADTTESSTGTVGYDTSGPTTDDAMTRSEEQLHVGTERREAGRARLRKYVVTEQQTVNVPVSHEEVRLEREPITDGNVGAALDGPAISEEEHEVVLHEERVVVDKEAVPVERVKLGTETVTENQSVTEDVRKEQIDLDDRGDRV